MSKKAGKQAVYKEESYPLLREAYAIIDGIPEDRINLNRWRSRGTSPYECGTIACAAGWLAMHPKMQEKGLHNDGGAPRVKSTGWLMSYTYGFTALAYFFDLTPRQACHIFGTRDEVTMYDPENADDLSDKELWKARVRNFLAGNVQAASFFGKRPRKEAYAGSVLT